MGPEGDYQPFLPNSNGKQPPPFSPLPTSELSHLEEDKLDLRQILTVARRRAIVIIGVAVAVTSGIVAKTLNQTPNYQGKFQLLVGPASGENQVDQLKESLSLVTGESMDNIDYETQIQVLWSPQVLSGIVDKIQTRYPDVDYDALREKLEISRLGETKILEVRYQDSDPEKIQFVLDQVASQYIAHSQQEQQTSVTNGLAFVKKQTEDLQDRVSKLQTDLQNFRQRYNIIDPETQGELLTNRVSAIVQARQETQTQLSEAQQLEQQLRSQLGQLGLSPEQAIAATALSEAPRYQELLNQLAEVEQEIAVESARFTEADEHIQALLDKRNNLLPLLRSEAGTVLGGRAAAVENPESLASPSSLRLALTEQLVETTNQRRVLEVRRQAIAQAEGQMNGQLNNLAEIAREYTDLQRELNVATESLNRFLGVRETLQIEEAQQTPTWKLISEPREPEAPISPNVPRGLVLGAVAGLLAGAGAGLLAEKMDRVFHSPDELKDSTGLPILGRIPFEKKLKVNTANPSSENTLELEFERRSYAYTASPFLEAFRSLHANLHFLTPDQPIRSLVVSSAVPGDGKSTTATFLAQAAAAMGQRVLLVDADLRRSQIHITTDLPNVWGLSNVISSEINADDVIQRSPVEDNLFVLTAGQVPPDPTRLLSSKKMQKLVERFQESFDLVIFDTPPMLGLADARLLSTHADGIVMVVGLGRTDRAVLTEVLYGLRMSRARVLGTVANGVKDYAASTSGYYHRYFKKAPQQEVFNGGAPDLL